MRTVQQQAHRAPSIHRSGLNVSDMPEPGPKKKEVEGFDLKGYDNIVDFVIQTRYKGSLTDFAQELTLTTRRYVTRQKIDGWRVRGQFPVDWIETIHALTRIPLRALLHRTMPR